MIFFDSPSFLGGIAFVALISELIFFCILPASHSTVRCVFFKTNLRFLS